MDALDVLRRYWGYDSFRELQLEIITSVLSGADTLGLLPTGGGKSLTFQVPAMMLPGLTVVVTPLISLMKDQVDNLRDHGIRAYAIHSGMSRSETTLACDRCRLGKCKLLYISPERLQSQAFIDMVRTWNISLIVVDEAHCISQWGYDFRPSYLQIRRLREVFPAVNVLALTASATPEVAEDIKRQLGFRPGSRQFAKSFDRDNLSYVVRYDDYKERTLINVLKAIDGCAIVYVRSRRRCRELAEILTREGITASYYHAGLDTEDKEERQTLWKDDKVRVMVATNAFGMGIDKPDVRVVVHIDLPSTLEEYYQEAGRAGRDGKPSYAVTIVAQSDKGLLTRRLNDAFPPKDYIKRVYELLGNFLDVAVGSGYNETYEFNYELFCVRFGLQPWLTYSALKLLTRAGYIDFVDEIQSKSRVMIIARKDEFYNLHLDETTDRVFSALQRTYTGLFADFVHIDENLLARRAEVSAQQVYESLLTLSRQHVITYVPRKSTPYVMYTTSREEPKYLLLPKEVYEDRRLRMEQRIEAVKRFAFDSTTCRSATILRYFGEKDATDCGRCDVCRSRAARPADKQERADMEADVMARASADGGVEITTLMASVAPSRRNDLIDLVRALIDEGRLRKTDNILTADTEK